MYRELKEYDKAIESYKQAISLEPTASRYDTLGDIYREAKKYDKAVEAYQTAIKLDPKWATLHHDLGYVYLEMKVYQAAIEAYQAAIALDPKYVSPHNGLGYVYLGMKAYQAAIGAWKVAIALDSQNAWHYYHLGIVYACMRIWENAIIEWENAIELEPRPRYYRRLAHGFRQLGHEVKSVEYLEKAREGLSTEPVYHKACFEAIAGEMDAALDYLRQAKAEGSSSMNGWVKDDPDLESLRGLPAFWEIVGE